MSRLPPHRRAPLPLVANTPIFKALPSLNPPHARRPATVRRTGHIFPTIIQTFSFSFKRHFSALSLDGNCVRAYSRSNSHRMFGPPYHRRCSQRHPVHVLPCPCPQQHRRPTTSVAPVTTKFAIPSPPKDLLLWWNYHVAFILSMAFDVPSLTTAPTTGPATATPSPTIPVDIFLDAMVPQVHRCFALHRPAPSGDGVPDLLTATCAVNVTFVTFSTLVIQTTTPTATAWLRSS